MRCAYLKQKRLHFLSVTNITDNWQNIDLFIYKIMLKKTFVLIQDFESRGDNKHL